MVNFLIYIQLPFSWIFQKKSTHSLFGAWSFFLVHIRFTPCEGPKAFKTNLLRSWTMNSDHWQRPPCMVRLHGPSCKPPLSRSVKRLVGEYYINNHYYCGTTLYSLLIVGHNNLPNPMSILTVRINVDKVNFEPMLIFWQKTNIDTLLVFLENWFGWFYFLRCLNWG